MIKRMMFNFFVFCVATAIVAGFISLAVRAIEIETDWRSDRLCQQGYHCEPGAGP